MSLAHRIVLATAALSLGLVAACQTSPDLDSSAAPGADEQASPELAGHDLEASEIKDPDQDPELACPGIPHINKPSVTGDYECIVDANGASTCAGPVDASFTAAGVHGPEGQWWLRADMKSFQQLDVYAYVCNPTGWSAHLSDSPTGNGWGGDGATTDHDAEGYLYRAGAPGSAPPPAKIAEFFSAWDHNRNVACTYARETNAFDCGCGWVRLSFLHDGETANSCFVYSSDTTTETVQSIHGPKRGYGECAGPTDPTRSIETDCEDPSGADAFYWYAGLNRTVGSPGRWGTGLESAIIKLHKVATPEMPYACTHSATIADPGDEQQPAND